MQTKILFADADDSVRKMVTRVLQSSGYAVIATVDAAAAATILESTKPDLLLLDLPVPNTEGWAALENLHRAEPSTPIIVTTAWPIQRKPLPVGIAALMEKPLDLSLLLQTIACLIETRVSVEWKTTGFDCTVRKSRSESEEAAGVHAPEIAY